MCGIAGFLRGHSWPADPGAVLDAMGQALEHRGPDGAGTWIDGAQGVALVHRRLAILDLTPSGHQPMVSHNGRFVLVFNGEFYNHVELRQSLVGGGVTFSGTSDTEVFLAAVQEWGLARALRLSTGMFAFALWDRHEGQLTLGRDRFGEKPLYFGEMAGNFVFASELKALRHIPGYSPRIDLAVLGEYLRVGCVPTPRSILAGIEKLPPGHTVGIRMRPGGGFVRSEAAYWRARDYMQHETVGTGGMPTYEAAREQAELLLRTAVRQQILADVPVGAFLSGGVDSTTVVALMQEESSRPVRTFSIGSWDPAYNEAPYAAAVAAHLGTDHTELYVTGDDALAMAARMPDIYDEPFADSSQIPTALVAQLARRDVTVALTGDAGDEVFGGYNRYLWGPRVWRHISRFPLVSRKVLAALLNSQTPKRWNQIARAAAPFLPPPMRFELPGEKLQKLSGLLLSSSPWEMYERLVSFWQIPPLAPQLKALSFERWFDTNLPTPRSDEDFVGLMIYTDLVTYMPDDILAKVDRAAKASSLECRAPFLDHHLVEFMLGMPTAYKINGNTTKRILRDIVASRVPDRLMNRPKVGFGVPIDSWLRVELRDWAEDLLAPEQLRRDGLLDWQAVRRAWDDHVSGRRLRHHELWTVLMLQAWIRRTGAHA